MKILCAEIEEFGKLEHRRFTFGNGITLIEGENESGKSTLLAFFRFVLYGFPRRGGAEGAERDKRLSFRNRRAAGSLTISVNEREYRIFRSFTAKTERETAERLSVTEEPEGRETELDGKTPGEFFLGLPAELYDSSLCVRQSEIDRVGEGDVSGKVGELLASTGGAERAGRLLENARRTLCHRKGRGGRIAALEDEEAELARKIATATGDAASLAGLSEQEKQEAACLSECKAGLSALNAAAEKVHLAGLLEQHRELCRAEDEARGAAIRVRELENRLAALPDDAALSALGELLDQTRESKQCFARADAHLRAFEPNLPPAATVTADAYAGGKSGGTASRSAAGGEHEDADRNTPPAFEGAFGTKPTSARAETGSPTRKETGRTVHSGSRKPSRSARGFCAFAVLSALFALSIAVLAALPVSKPFGLSSPLLWGIAGGGTLLCVVFAIFSAICRKGKPISEAHLAARENYSRTLENFLDLAKSLCTEWKKTCGVAFVPAANAEAVLREYAKERGGVLSEIRAKKEAYDRAAGRAELLRARVGAIRADAVQQRLNALAPFPAPAGTEDELAARRDALQMELAEHEERLRGIRQTLAAHSATANDPATLARARAEIAEKLAKAKGQLAALDLAKEALTAAESELRRNIAPTLCCSAKEIFCRLCPGESGHDALYLGADFSVTLRADGANHPLSCFSAGCRDAAYLALRIALTELLTAEPLPLLFDEPAARLDDCRTAAFLALLAELAKGGAQCLLFTCHHREAAMLTDIAPFARIAL